MFEPIRQLINLFFKHPFGKWVVKTFMKLFKVDVHYL